MMIDWIVFAGLGIAGLAILFVILTDGRYFGKGLMHWIYDHFGPAIFNPRSEAGRWLPLVEMLQLRGDEAILDVGTATGSLPLTIAYRPGFRGLTTGVDWSPRMIAQAREEAREQGVDNRTRFNVVDVRQGLPFDDGEFDAVICLQLLETLPQPEHLLSELTRVLKPGGVLMLSLYKGWTAWNTSLSFNWYQQNLTNFGAFDLEVSPFGRNQDILIARLGF